MSVTLREERRARVVECWVLREICGGEWEEEVAQNCKMKSLMISTSSHVLFVRSHTGG